MDSQPKLEEELKAFIVSTLALEDIEPSDIQSEQILFGEGLGLDSIDALELAVAIQKKYDVKISGDSAETREHFTSVETLASFIRSNSSSEGDGQSGTSVNAE